MIEEGELPIWLQCVYLISSRPFQIEHVCFPTSCREPFLGRCSRFIGFIMFEDPDGRAAGLEDQHVLPTGCLEATRSPTTGKVPSSTSLAGCVVSLELPQAQPYAPFRLVSEFATSVLGQLGFQP